MYLECFRVSDDDKGTSKSLGGCWGVSPTFMLWNTFPHTLITVRDKTKEGDGVWIWGMRNGDMTVRVMGLGGMDGRYWGHVSSLNGFNAFITSSRLITSCLKGFTAFTELSRLITSCLFARFSLYA